MGYELTFKFKNKELLPEFKTQFGSFKEEDIEAQKDIIIVYCMRKPEIDGLIGLHNLRKNLDLSFKMLISYIEDVWKANLKRRIEKDEEFFICGREFSHNDDGDNEWLISRAMQKIFIITSAVETPDFFEKETNFWGKEEKIREILDEVQEAVEDKWYHKFVDTYRNNDELCETEESY